MKHELCTAAMRPASVISNECVPSLEPPPGLPHFGLLRGSTQCPALKERASCVLIALLVDLSFSYSKCRLLRLERCLLLVLMAL